MLDSIYKYRLKIALNAIPQFSDPLKDPRGTFETTKRHVKTRINGKKSSRNLKAEAEANSMTFLDLEPGLHCWGEYVEGVCNSTGYCCTTARERH